jgi:hypothetical protein
MRDSSSMRQRTCWIGGGGVGGSVGRVELEEGGRGSGSSEAEGTKEVAVARCCSKPPGSFEGGH